MQNLEIARVLGEVADLLDIKGANPFRIRAYRNAVRTIGDLTRSLSELVKAGEDLTEFQGIGKEMAAHIRELVERGELTLLEELGREVPRTLADLVRLDGVGPKKAKKLWEELGVTSVDELAEVLPTGRVEALDGFGVQSVAKMTASIEEFRSRRGRFLLSDVDILLTSLIGHMEELEEVERVEVAGSYRRRRETVGDADLLVLCEEGRGRVMDHFTAYPGAREVESAGETRGRILLRSGLPVDIRILPRESYGAALQYFTGSKEHNVALRTMGVEEGLKVNEYGVFRGEDRVAGAEEKEVYRALDLPWIDPRLREDRGEIQAAARGDLPDLLSIRDMRGDLQMHSTWSDGKNTLRKMAEACRDRGYEYFSITDHSQAVTVAGGLDPARVREQWEEIEEVREAVEGICLFRSLEVDILKDGSLDMPDDTLEGLDLVLVSVHSYMDMSRAEMTDRVVRALEHPQVDILAHPTGRILNRREPYELDVEAVLQAAAELQVAVELNAHPQRLDLHEGHLRRAKELGVKVAVSTDAHSVRDLALMSYGVDQACRGWLEKEDVLNAMPLEEFQAWRSR